MWRIRVVLAFAAIVAFAAPRSAHACACCTNPGQRNVNIDALDQGKRALLEELRFADAAKLYLGEADPDSVAGSPIHRRLLRSRPRGRKTGSSSR